MNSQKVFFAKTHFLPKRKSIVKDVISGFWILTLPLRPPLAYQNQ